MASDDLMLIFKAQSIIQREALLSALAGENVEAMASPRHMSNRIADGTVDLALEGYSAVFDGFPIFVKERDRVPAQRAIRDFLETTETFHESAPTDASPHLTKYFFCSIFTILLPVIFHAMGLYHLVKGLRSGEPIQPWRFFAGSVLFAATLWTSILFLMNSF